MIKYWQYLDDYERDRQDILAAVDRVFSSGRLILGGEVERFERDFAAYCGTDHAVGVNSGTDALFLALKVLDIGRGDEVITVANTAVPTIAAIRAAGAIPVFVDVEEDTSLMDARLVEAAVTKRTRCILPVHLFGQMADMDPLRKAAKRHKLRIVEDCAQAAGATYHGAKAGSFSDIAAFSFYPTKVLGGFGDGGMAVTKSRKYGERLRRLRFYGMADGQHAEEEGYNSRLDEVHAALLDQKLSSLDDAVRRRRLLAAAYTDLLAGIGDIGLPSVRPGREHQFYVYTIRTKRRDRLQQFLLRRGIETRINYPTPVHRMRAYRSLGYLKGSLPVTERLAAGILSLPLYPALSRDDAARCAAAIKDFFDSSGSRNRAGR